MIVKTKCKECGKLEITGVWKQTRKAAHKIKQEYKNDQYCNICKFRRTVRKNIKGGFSKCLIKV